MARIPNPMSPRTPHPAAAPWVPAPAGGPAFGPPQSTGPKKSRPAWVWWLIAVIALVLMLLASCSTAARDQSERLGLVSQNEELSESLDEAIAAVDEAEAAQEDAEAAAADLEGELALVAPGLAEAEAAVVVAIQERDDARAAVTTLEARVAELEADLAAAQAPAAAPAPVFAAPSTSGSSGGSSSGSSSVYYQNCSAARAAGAAPVYRGEPGYGSHLDRDNDGVGCE